MIIFTFLVTDSKAGQTGRDRQTDRAELWLGIARWTRSRHRYLKSAYVACIVLTVLEELLFQR